MKRFLVLVLMVFGYFVHGQTGFDEEWQVWSEFDLNFRLSNKSTLGLDLGYDTNFTDSAWHSKYLYPRFSYSINQRLTFTGAVGTYWTKNPSIGSSFELRFVQQVNYTWPTFNWGMFTHRVKIEERAFMYEDETDQLRDNVSYRGRYNLRAESQDWNMLSDNWMFYAFMSMEFFIPVDRSSTERFINSRRGVVGFGHRIGTNFHYEVQYVRQASKAYSNDGEVTKENIIQLKAILFIQSKKKQEDQ